MLDINTTKEHEFFRRKLYNKTGELFTMKDNVLFLPLNVLDKFPVSDLPHGLILRNQDDRTSNNFEISGFFNTNYSIRNTEEGEIWVEIISTQEESLSLDFKRSDFLELKSKVASKLARDYFRYRLDTDNGKLIYQIRPYGVTVKKLLENAKLFEQNVNSTLEAVCCRIFELFRANLGLPSVQTPIKRHRQSFGDEAEAKIKLESITEEMQIIDPQLVNNKWEVIVNCRYPSLYWEEDIKLDWFLALKQELINFQHNNNNRVLSIDNNRRTLSFKIILDSNEDNPISSAEKFNIDLNNKIIRESHKLNEYFEIITGDIRQSPLVRQYHGFKKTLFSTTNHQNKKERKYNEQ